jgi:tRNA nucleotidyltransferase (CCA-adding enzyme)
VCLAAGLPVREIDLATSEEPYALAESVALKVGGEAHIEPRFGTASVGLRAHRVDFAALRTEHYARPGALPVVHLDASIEDDLARRDFTVNAFALGLSQEARDRMVDPYGGIADLEARRLRVLHDRSFIDDATRLWRGARYAARLKLRPDLDTASLIEAGSRWLAPISAKRLWAEFERTAAEPRVGATLALLDAWGVLAVVDPAFEVHAAAARALKRRRGPVPAEVLLALLVAPLPDEARAAITRRLGAPGSATRAVADAARLLEASDVSPDMLRTFESVSAAGLTAAQWLDPPGQERLQRGLRRWKRTASPLSARELLALGVEEGPALGALLYRLRREQYLGTLAGAEDARRRVRAWADQADEGAAGS